MNAANEAAVAAFLERRIGFYDIPSVIERVCAGVNFAARPSVQDIFDTHEEAFARALELIR